MASTVSQTQFFKNRSSQISIGRYTYGHEALTVAHGEANVSLCIGSFCSIGPSVSIFLGGNHRIDWITTFPFGHLFTDELGGEGIIGHPSSYGDVIIGNDVWIGYNSTIMSGITIGDGAVVAANSHVVRDIAPYSIVGGNPAKEISMRFTSEIRALLLELKWWELPVDEIRQITQNLSSAPTIESLKVLIIKYASTERHLNKYSV